MKEDDQGNLPLHVALANPDLKLVRHLVKKQPLSLQVRNATGMRAVHVAASNDAPLDVVYHLASTWPQAVGYEGSGGGTAEPLPKRLKKAEYRPAPANDR